MNVDSFLFLMHNFTSWTEF